MKLKPCIVGIDFGTTSLSAVVINVDKGCIEKVFNYNTNAYIPCAFPFQKEQSIEILTKLFYSLLQEIDTITDISVQAYSFTGQMHGVVGINNQLQAVTNLVTWEDKSGDMILPEGIKLLDKIKALSGDNTLSNGYGIVILYKWLHIEKRADINCFCTAPDYFAGLLANKIGMTPSMAHSIGLFDIHANQWAEEPIKKLNLSLDLFPPIVEESSILGYIQKGQNTVPIISAMGDNQASFLGSITDKNSVLLNVGTGAQISALIRKDEKSIFSKYIDNIETQLRPYDKDFYLMSTSFVNGGSIYKSLFNFFKESAKTLFGLDEIDESKLWKNMEKVARERKEIGNELTVLPLLAGQRKAPNIKGEISNLTLSNFTPSSLIRGFLSGLAEHYKTGFFPELSQRVEYVCASGNGLKRNHLFVEIIEETFNKPIHITPYNEEAAVGAALNAIFHFQLNKFIFANNKRNI